MASKDLIVTFDGPAGAGKSTVARLTAKALNFLYLDTGSMYRALALKAVTQGVDLRDEEQLLDLYAKAKLFWNKEWTDPCASVWMEMT